MSEINLRPDQWDDAVADTDGPQLVVAGPGQARPNSWYAEPAISSVAACHQSESCSWRSRVAAAADLKARVAAGMERSFTVISASTFHSLAMRILEAQGPVAGWTATPTLLTGPEHIELVAETLRTEDAAQWPVLFRPLLGSRAFAEEVADFGLRAAERMVDADALAAFARDDWRALPGFFSRYRTALLARGRIDYGTSRSRRCECSMIPPPQQSSPKASSTYSSTSTRTPPWPRSGLRRAWRAVTATSPQRVIPTSRCIRSGAPSVQCRRVPATIP